MMTAMWEEANKSFFLGVEVYSFGLFAALGAALALIELFFLLRKAQWKKGTAALTGVLAVGFGFVLSRVLFGLLDFSLGALMPLWAMAWVTSGGYSMMGALLGACLGAVLSAKLTRQSAARLLDFLAPALLLFVACERLGEGYVEFFGISRDLTVEALYGTFLTVDGDGEWYLATYLIESFTALVLALILLRDQSRSKKPGDTFLLFLLLFGATQTLLESLRYDGHMNYSFVKMQHVMAITLLGSGLIALYFQKKKSQRRLGWAALLVLPVAGGLIYGLLYAINHGVDVTVLSLLFCAAVLIPAGLEILAKGDRLGVTAILSIPLMVALGVALEFAIDRSQMSRVLIYALYAILIFVPMVLGVRLRREA